MTSTDDECVPPNYNNNGQGGAPDSPAFTLLHAHEQMVGGLALQRRSSLVATWRVVSSITQSAEHQQRCAGFPLVEASKSSHIRRPLRPSTDFVARRCLSSSLHSQETADDGSPPTHDANRGVFGEDGEDYPLEKNTDKISMDELLALASCHPTALSLEAMYKYAPKKRNKNQRLDLDRLRNAQFLHKELPIRIAQRAIDLLTLPHGLNRTRDVQAVANTYIRYLQVVRDFPMPTNAESEREFTRILKTIVLDRHSIPMAIARGLQSLKDGRRAPIDGQRLREMEEALNRFFTARAGLRFLVEHHILSGNDENSDALYKKQLEAEGGLELLHIESEANSYYDDGSEDECCGAIQKNCDPMKEVKRTVARVTKLCRDSYGICPDIEIVDCTPDAQYSFTYVPHHLRYMVAELLKNGCRATVRNYLAGSNMQKEDHDGGLHDAPTLPPIRIIVAKGAEDVTIKIADRGGGMPRSLMQRIWTFAHSTLKKEKPEEEKGDFEKDEYTGRHIRGFGLPLTRIYARYFGGEVTIKSMEGYGVDAYLYLPVLGVACENLPQRVIRSPGNLDSSQTGELFDDEGFFDADAFEDLGYKTEGSSRNDDFFQDANFTRRFDSTGSSQRPTGAALDSIDRKAL